MRVYDKQGTTNLSTNTKRKSFSWWTKHRSLRKKGIFPITGVIVTRAPDIFLKLVLVLVLIRPPN